MSKPTIVAITGATGFLGRYVAEAFAKENVETILISRKLNIDITSLDDISKIPRFDILIHLAAKTFVPESYTDTASFYYTNVLGTVNCLEICKKYKADIVFISSYVYGKPQYLPIDETHPTALWNPYATSKVIGEILCKSYAKEFGVNTTILRVFNIYGPGQNPNFVIPKMVDGIKRDCLTLESATPKRDFIYVLDVVEAIIKVVNLIRDGVNTYNVGSGKSYSVGEIVDTAARVLDKKLDPFYENKRRKTDIADVVADISKIKQELGWSPKYDLEYGIKEMLK